jgi:uncharacterized protein
MPTERDDLPFTVRVVEDLKVPMPDGTLLAAKAWIPEGAGRVPAILEYLPYRKRDGTRGRDAKMHGYLAGHSLTVAMRSPGWRRKTGATVRSR